MTQTRTQAIGIRLGLFGDSEADSDADSNAGDSRIDSDSRFSDLTTTMDVTIAG